MASVTIAIKNGASERRVRFMRHLIPSLSHVALAVLVFVAWELAVRVLEPRPDLLPPPSRVATAAWTDRARLLEHTVPTLVETLVGVAVAFFIAAVTAGVLDFFPRISQPLLSLFVAAQAVPIVAIAPLMVIWFGFGLLPKVILIVVVTFFPLTIATLAGLKSADGEATRLLQSMGATKFQILWHLRVPSSVPFVATGLRVVMSYAVTAAIFAEYVGSEKGLGIYLLLARNSLRTDLVFAAVLVAVFFSVLLFMLTYLFERLLAPWESRRKRAAK